MKRAFKLQLQNGSQALCPEWSIPLPGCPVCGGHLDLMNWTRVEYSQLAPRGTHVDLIALCSNARMYPDEECVVSYAPCGTEVRLRYAGPLPVPDPTPEDGLERPHPATVVGHESVPL